MTAQTDADKNLNQASMNLWTSKQMEALSPVDQAKKAILHVLNVARENWQVGYHLGMGTQSFSLLTEAAATLCNAPLESLREEYCPDGEGKQADTEVMQAVRSAVNDYRIRLNRKEDPISARYQLIEKLLKALPES